ncbi:MAG: hypothetical protein ABIL61_06705 [candidate division WOR-3 bacterium]
MVIILALFSNVKTLYFVNDVTPIKVLKYGNEYYLFGIYQYNSFVIKLNAFKVPIWSRMIYNTNLSDAIIQKDTIIIFSNYPLFSIVKLDVNGNLISYITYDTQNNFSYNFFADIFNDFYLTAGNYVLKLKNNGKIDWIKSYSNVDFCKGTSNFYLFCRYSYNKASIIKIDQNGNILKAKTFGIYNSITPIKAFSIKDKIYAFAQYTDISLKYYIWIVSMDTQLNTIFWSKIYKPVDNIDLYITDIQYVNDRFVISGNYFNEVFFFSIDTLGNLLFSRRSNTSSLENNAKLFDNLIYFYKQDSLIIFEFDLNSGLSCYSDTMLQIVVLDIYSEPFSDIQINLNDVNATLYNYPITTIDFTPYENSYCRVNVNEEKKFYISDCEIYDINGRYLGKNLKKLKKNNVYILKDKKGVRKIFKF